MAESTSYTYLNAYCERAGNPGFWAEPLNAVTNILFIAFAIYAVFQLLQVRGRKFFSIFDIWFLIFAMLCIGVGSGLWHTLAKPWSLLADVIPIALFINVCIFSLYLRVMQWKVWQVILLWIIFQTMSVGAEVVLPSDTLNGSIMYVPALLMLVFSIWVLPSNQSLQRQSLIVITLAFLVSLTFRTLDLILCNMIQWGTHFLWHGINAYVLYALLMLIIKQPIRVRAD